MLAFLLVYGLVAVSSLRVALPGNTRSRHLVVGGACLVAVSAMAVAYFSGAVGQQNGMLLTFVGLLLLGCAAGLDGAARAGTAQVITVGRSIPVRALISAS